MTDSDMKIVKVYFGTAITWAIGLILAAGLVFGIVIMFVYGAVRQDEINRANDCEFTQDKPFAQEWHLKNCSE